MASKNDGIKECVTFLWNIENFSYCWQNKKERIWSPNFTSDCMEDTEWSLNLYPRGNRDENYIAFYLQRHSSSKLDNLEIECELAFLAEDGSVLEKAKGGKEAFDACDWFGSDTFAEREVVLKAKRDSFLPGDTLRAHCRIWMLDKKDLENVQIFARTVINVDHSFFVWDIGHFSTFQPEQKFINRILSESAEIPITHILYLDCNPCGEEKISINIRFDPDYLNYVRYFTFETTLLDSEGNKWECGLMECMPWNKLESLSYTLPFTKKYLVDNKNAYLKDDVLSLNCRSIISSGIDYERFEIVNMCA
ncbi:TD and POZ domain-containing protein 3 [Trichonephila inaurata madagascariensis]|uniref:TD and POZ domain-containing protein 3 n=1 Tax=Trichonephila inaurata madagascariensis TaxID=2747483 RepID=A0A8X6X1E3_9ARAC|nr:TD and POZ domain-containing protein 3 [Trichonephila inaurata madagascariensis]